MLENTFGEYSYRQLKNIVQILNEKEEIGEEKLEWIKNIIDRVGEKTIKKKIMQLYEKKAHDKNNLINMLLARTIPLFPPVQNWGNTRVFRTLRLLTTPTRKEIKSFIITIIPLQAGGTLTGHSPRPRTAPQAL